MNARFPPPQHPPCPPSEGPAGADTLFPVLRYAPPPPNLLGLSCVSARRVRPLIRVIGPCGWAWGVATPTHECHVLPARGPEAGGCPAHHMSVPRAEARRTVHWSTSLSARARAMTEMCTAPRLPVEGQVWWPLPRGWGSLRWCGGAGPPAH